MRYEFKPSFSRSIKHLEPGEKNQLKANCLAFIELLENQVPLPAGVGLKRLRKDYWEIRHGFRNRILFRWKSDLIEFILAGNHDSIRAFLKSC